MSVSSKAEEEADKKHISGPAKKRYVGGAINRAKQEKAGTAKKKAAPAKPTAKKTTTKPAAKKTTAKKETAPSVKIEHYSPKPLATGSEKQRAWAEKIREHSLKEVRDFYEPTLQSAIKEGKLTSKQEAGIHAYNRAYAHLARQSSAEWWIYHKISASGSVFQRFLKQQLDKPA